FICGTLPGASHRCNDAVWERLSCAAMIRRVSLAALAAVVVFLGFHHVSALAQSPSTMGGFNAQSTPPRDKLCSSYSGLPAETADKAGMVFIPGGSFNMGSDKERTERNLQNSSR